MITTRVNRIGRFVLRPGLEISGTQKRVMCAGLWNPHDVRLNRGVNLISIEIANTPIGLRSPQEIPVKVVLGHWHPTLSESQVIHEGLMKTFVCPELPVEIQIAPTLKLLASEQKPESSPSHTTYRFSMNISGSAYSHINSLVPCCRAIMDCLGIDRATQVNLLDTDPKVEHEYWVHQNGEWILNQDYTRDQIRAEILELYNPKR